MANTQQQAMFSSECLWLVLDTTATITQANDKAIQRLNSTSQLLGSHWLDYITNNERSRAKAFLQKALDQPQYAPYQFISHIEASGSAPFTVQWLCFPIEQTSTSLSLIGFETTSANAELPATADAFKNLQANAQAILDNAVEAIISINIDGTITAFNRAAEEVFGYCAKEVIGKNVKLLMPEPHRGNHDQYMKNYLQTGVKKIIGIGREVVGLRKDGGQFPMELSVAEVRIGDQHSFTGIIRDISERKNAQEQLRLRDEELQQTRDKLMHVDRLNVMGEMAAGIAHELNQPLTAITTYAQATKRLIDSNQHDLDNIRDILERISQQALRSGEVIKRLRAMVSQQRAEHQLVPVTTLIEETLALARVDIEESYTQIHPQFADAELIVEVDPIQIQQVLLNLIRNAIDALKNNHKHERIITIGVQPAAATVKVSIKDNGPGLSADTTAVEIFNPFFTTKKHGMGMGLAICRSIIVAHGGELNVNTASETEFYFTLPLAINFEEH